MIYKDHVIYKMTDVLQEDFPGEIEKRAHRFVVGELLLIFKCVMDV